MADEVIHRRIRIQQRWEFFFLPGLLLLIVCGGLLAFHIHEVNRPMGSLSDTTPVHEAAKPLIAALDQYRIDHGAFPDSLERLPIDPPAVQWGTGEWTYELYGRGAEEHYYISILWEPDNYYQSYYNSDRGEWGIDR